MPTKLAKQSDLTSLDIASTNRVIAATVRSQAFATDKELATPYDPNVSNFRISLAGDDTPQNAYAEKTNAGCFKTANGTLFVGMCGRTVADADGHDTDILLCRSWDGGRSFEAPVTVYGHTGPTYPTGVDATAEMAVFSLNQDPGTGRIYLWITSVPSVESGGSVVNKIILGISDNEGDTWTFTDETSQFPAGIGRLYFTQQHGIYVNNQFMHGVWYTLTATGATRYAGTVFSTGTGNSRSFHLNSDIRTPSNFGANPITGATIGTDLEEAAVAAREDGSVYLLSRSNSMPYKAVSIGTYTTFTTGSLVVGDVYEITDNSGGLDMTNVGASANTVGTVFEATGTTPTSWGTGELKGWVFSEAKKEFQIRSADWGALGEHTRGAKAGLLKFNFGDVPLLVYSFPDGTHDSSQDRRNPALQYSLDDGTTWSGVKRLSDSDILSFIYSDLVQIDDTTFGLAYQGRSFNNDNAGIYFTRIKADWLFSREDHSTFAGTYSPLHEDGLNLWLDPSDVSTLTLSGSVVTDISDKSFEGNDVTTPVGNFTYDSDGIQKTFASLQIPDGSYGQTATGFTGGEVFFVLRPDRTTFSALIGTEGLSTEYVEIFIQPAGPSVSFDGGAAANPEGSYAFNGAALSAEADNHSASPSADLWTICRFRYASGDAPSFRNIGRRDTTASASMVSAVTFGMLLVFDRQLSDDEARRVEGWLAHKCGFSNKLPTNHPYRNFRI